MIGYLMAVLDKKAGTYGMVWLAPSKGVAVRQVSDQLANEDVYSKHPEDFALYCVGELDQQNGEVNAPAGNEIDRFPELVIEFETLKQE